MRWLIGVIAALAIGLGIPAPAGATPLDANDLAFIRATDQVIMGGNAADPNHWIGYPGVATQLRIETAHSVCNMLDDGALSANDFIVTAFDDRREHAGYLAAWFEQIAITYYCPRHSDKIGII